MVLIYLYYNYIRCRAKRGKPSVEALNRVLIIRQPCTDFLTRPSVCRPACLSLACLPACLPARLPTALFTTSFHPPSRGAAIFVGEVYF